MLILASVNHQVEMPQVEAVLEYNIVHRRIQPKSDTFLHYTVLNRVTVIIRCRLRMLAARLLCVYTLTVLSSTRHFPLNLGGVAIINVTRHTAEVEVRRS